MKHYKRVYDLGDNCIEEVLSERDIINYYFDWWSEQMSKKGKAHLISYGNCIKDWVEINIAMEVICE